MADKKKKYAVRLECWCGITKGVIALSPEELALMERLAKILEENAIAAAVMVVESEELNDHNE